MDVNEWGWVKVWGGGSKWSVDRISQGDRIAHCVHCPCNGRLEGPVESLH